MYPRPVMGTEEGGRGTGEVGEVCVLVDGGRVTS